ncbi:M23 family metallopeptidase [Candidatus Curtissbacteria bacterium]|nr:M23 family metallopeptidase [Candidatus Curtissbacteria bacterium]
MKKKIKSTHKTKAIYARFEAKKGLKRALNSLQKHIMIRPRLRLFSKLVLVAVLALLPLSYASRVVAENRGKVVMNGHKILVAEPVLPKPDNELNNIGQQVNPAVSPFQFHMPVDGYISQGFSAYHRGVDIAADLGKPIHPLGDGNVIYAGFMTDGHGKTVVVDHGNGLKSLYAHMDRIYVGVGNHVDGQAPIGTIGLTGHTTGPHVHIELTDNDIFVDPSKVLPN